MADKSISIVIPAYNEEKRIGKTLEQIFRYFEKKPYSSEIIVVDDGSSDRTLEVVSKNKSVKVLKNEKNMGKGYAVKRGMFEGGGDYLLFSDADLSTPIEEVEKLFYWLENGYDIAIGSRSLKESKVIVRQSLWRELLGKLFNKFVKLLVIKDFIDTQCGFKLFKKEAAREIFERQKIFGFIFDVEILHIAKKAGFKIKEVPVRWINSPESKVGILSNTFKTVFDLIRIKFTH